MYEIIGFWLIKSEYKWSFAESDWEEVWEKLVERKMQLKTAIFKNAAQSLRIFWEIFKLLKTFRYFSSTFLPYHFRSLLLNVKTIRKTKTARVNDKTCACCVNCENSRIEGKSYCFNFSYCLSFNKDLMTIKQFKVTKLERESFSTIGMIPAKFKGKFLFESIVIREMKCHARKQMKFKKWNKI